MTQRIHFLFTSDTHANWLNRPDDLDHSLLNTSQALADLRKTYQDLGDGVITLDLGDFLQGSSFATYLREVQGDGEVIGRAMNQAGYDYQVLGNHEFNYPSDYRQRVFERMKADFLNANILWTKDQMPIIGKPYTILEQAGVTIGIIGVTTHYIPHWELPAHYQGISFLDACQTTAKYVKELRPQVDLLVVAYHGGYEKDLTSFRPLEELTTENQGAQMLEEIEGIDLLLTGHQHREIVQKVGRTLTLQSGYGGEYIGHAMIEMAGHEIQNMQGELLATNSYPQSEVQYQNMQPELKEGEAWLNHVVGMAPIDQVTDNEFQARVFGHPYIELLNQIQLKETGADFSAVALVNDYFTLFHGGISNEILLKSYPFYNLIATVKVTGQDLYDIMNFNLEYFTLDNRGDLAINPDYLDPKPKHYNLDLYSGLKAEVDMTQSPGSRVIRLIDESKQTPIDRQANYRLAVSQYRAVGGGDFRWFNRDKIIQISEKDIASLLKEALETFTSQDWERINNNYEHLDYHPLLRLSNQPESLSEE